MKTQKEGFDSTVQKGLNTLFEELLHGFHLKDEVKDLLLKQLRLTVKRIEGDNFNNADRMQSKKSDLSQKLNKLERNNALGDVPCEIYKELKAEITKELFQIEEELEQSKIQISNLDKKLEDCILLTQNIDKIWASSKYDDKVKLQKMIFQAGLSIDPKNRQYRTKKINSVFSFISDGKRDTEGQKKTHRRKILMRLA